MLVLTEEKIGNIREDIIEKANRNKDRQAYIRPSEYGFGRRTEDTKDFFAILPQIVNCSKASIIGKDLIDLTLK